MGFIENEKNLITLALISIIIIGVISYNLYVNSNYDIDGNNLGCFDTIRNIFGLLPIIGTGIEKTIDLVTDVLDTTKDVVEKEVEKVTKKVKKIIRKKEVFNIDSNNYTYEEAPYVCQALDSKLATYDQVIAAHKKGANWCNYGWSANQMALYPTQQKVWDNLQKGPENSKKICGNPGINGGHFDNINLKFGVNCYGLKPKPDPTKLVYHNGEISDENIHVKSNELLNKFKQMANEGKLEVRPFSNSKWSKFSYKKSSYILNNNDNNKQVLETTISEEEKNPNTLEKENTINEEENDDDVI
jgi:hypothetical protein